MPSPAPEETLPEPMPFDARIFTVRGRQVMLDSDLAAVYGVLTKNLNRAVDRNPSRFPDQFTFQLSQNEWDILRFQFGTSNVGHGGRRYLPRVFTEHGAVMLASVLNSERAVQASIAVVNAFVRLRRALDSNRTLARKVDELAEKVGSHDRAIAVIFHELRQLAAGEPEQEPEKPKGRIGFKTPEEREREKGRKKSMRQAGR